MEHLEKKLFGWSTQDFILLPWQLRMNKEATRILFFLLYDPRNLCVDCLWCRLEDSTMTCNDREMWEPTPCNQPVHLTTGLQLLCRCSHNTSFLSSTRTKTVVALVTGAEEVYHIICKIMYSLSTLISWYRMLPEDKWSNRLTVRSNVGVFKTKAS